MEPSLPNPDVFAGVAVAVLFGIVIWDAWSKSAGSGRCRNAMKEPSTGPATSTSTDKSRELLGTNRSRWRARLRQSAAASVKQ